VPSPPDGCAISGPKRISTRPYLSDDLILAFPVGCELAMFVCACYGFHAAKDEVSYLDWLQLHCPVMEKRDAEIVKCFSKESMSLGRGEEIQGFTERYVV